MPETIHMVQELEQDPLTTRLEAIMACYESVATNYEIAKVGDAGYAVKLRRTEPARGKDWVLYDLDDTLIAYSEAKDERLNRFHTYLHSLGVELTPKDANEVMNMTDSIARWSENGVETYHVDMHITTLEWCTRQLQNSQGDIAETITDLPKLLQEAKERDALSQDTAAMPEEIFAAMLRPAVYEDALQSMNALAGPAQPEHAAAQAIIGIFTLGEAAFQLVKVLELLEAQAAAGQPLPVSHIWLTTVSKGDFLNELANMADGHDFIRQDIFDPTPHTLLLLDDSSDQIDSFARSIAGSQVTLSTLHAVQPNTKNGRKHAEKHPLHAAFDGWHATHSGNLLDFIYDRLRRSRLKK